jgi:hypothetical protein
MCCFAARRLAVPLPAQWLERSGADRAGGCGRDGRVVVSLSSRHGDLHAAELAGSLI